MSSVYDSIIQGLSEAVEYSKDANKKVRIHTVSVEPVPTFDSTSVKAVRNSLGMTQAVFASVMGVSKKTVEAWEQGANTPSGPSCRLLEMFRTDPSAARQIVREA